LLFVIDFNLDDIDFSLLDWFCVFSFLRASITLHYSTISWYYEI